MANSYGAKAKGNMKIIIAVLLSFSAVFAQSNFYAGGAYWDSEGKPHDGAMLVYGHQISDNSSSFTTLKLTRATSVKDFIRSANPPTVVSTGILTRIVGFGQTLNSEPKYSLNTVADAGGKMTASGGISAAFSGGGVFIVRTDRKFIQYIAFDLRLNKTGFTGAILFGNRN